MSVIRMAEYRNQGLIKALEHFLALAKSGLITGGAGVVKFGQHDHRAYTFGDYLSAPEQALPALNRLENELIKSLPKFSDSALPH